MLQCIFALKRYDYISSQHGSSVQLPLFNLKLLLWASWELRGLWTNFSCMQDMVAFSCCVFDGGEQEKLAMNAARERGWRGKFTKPGRIIRPGAIRMNGKCPLTPLEVNASRFWIVWLSYRCSLNSEVCACGSSLLFLIATFFFISSLLSWSMLNMHHRNWVTIIAVCWLWWHCSETQAWWSGLDINMKICFLLVFHFPLYCEVAG